MDLQKNRDILSRLSDTTLPFSQLMAMHNTSLVMFYAMSFMKDDVYYIQELDAAVFAEYKDDTLYLNDIFCSHNICLDDVISIMSKSNTKRVVLGFTPKCADGYDCIPLNLDNNTLFVLKQQVSIFDKHRLMLPILSHS